MMRCAVITLFGEMIRPYVEASVLGRAMRAGHLDVLTIDPRDDATDRHRTVDDNPFGGGAGMLMRAPELAAATHRARAAVPDAPVVLLSPQGRRLDHDLVRRLAARPGLILACGRYEGVDERWVERHVDLEVSVGDFVLTGGELGALCVIDAVARMHPGVLGNATSANDESFAEDRLEYPQFTRPPRWYGLDIPEVLTSGDHGRIERWRRRVALMRTAARRPDLLARRPLTDDEAKLLADDRDPVPAWMVRPRHQADTE